MSLKNFNKMGSKFQATLNQEMIAVQVDPKFIEEAVLALDIIMNTFKNDDKLTNVDYYKGKGLDNIKSLEGILSKRFGPQIVLAENTGNGAFAVLTSDAFVNHTEFDFIDYATMIDSVENEKSKAKLKDFENKADEYLKTNESSRLFTEYGSYLKLEYLQSSIKMIKQFTTGLKLDLKKAKVLTSPKNFTWYVSVDWRGFVNDGLTSKEMLALILHEIGHHWTFLEYSYKVYANTQSVVDTIMEEYINKHKTPSEVINIIYSKSGSKPPIKNPNDIQTVLLAAYKDIVRGERIDYGSKYNETEQQADEFSARFGLGYELVTGLKKCIYWNHVDDVFEAAVFNLFKPLNAITFIMCGIICSGAGISVFVYLLTLGPIAGVFSLMRMIQDFKKWITQDSRPANTYDLEPMRYKRIRNNAVKRLSYIKDPKLKEELINQIKEIDNVIDGLTVMDKKRLKNKIFNFFYGKTDTNYDFMMLIDELLANKIHVASAQWDLLVNKG